MKKQNVRTLSLIVFTFTYLLVGAAVFDAFESDTEKLRFEALTDLEMMFKKKYSISDDEYRVMETLILKLEPHRAGRQWKFYGAFYFATTLLTTIGYGHSTPCTPEGKIFVMCYGIVAVPLGLVMFQSIGERLNTLSSIVIRRVKRAFRCKKTSATELDLICIVTTLSSLTIAVGATAFSHYENWSYFDSVYYCFITLTTIGFGDMVALQKNNTLNTQPKYVVFTLAFILLGLAIVAASLNLMVLRFVTMNTEDERRDEAEALQAAQGAVRLEGDVITANGSLSNIQKAVETCSTDSGRTICSCDNCFNHLRNTSSPSSSTYMPPPVTIEPAIPLRDISQTYDIPDLNGTMRRSSSMYTIYQKSS